MCKPCLCTDLLLISQKWSPRFSHSQSIIFACFLDLASLVFSRGLVCVVQSASLIGHLWVLHLSGTVGLGRQTRNTICRQSHCKPILPVQFLLFADSRMVVFQASNMEYHRAFQKELLRTGAAGCFPLLFPPFSFGRLCAWDLTVKWLGMPRLSHKEWSSLRVTFWIEFVRMLPQTFWRPSKATHK